MTLQTALQQACKLLEEESVAAPRLTAEVLLCHALGRERSYLYSHPEAELSDLARLHFGRYLHERLAGKPTQYITGVQEFYGRDFLVTTGRPDSPPRNRARRRGCLGTLATSTADGGYRLRLGRYRHYAQPGNARRGRGHGYLGCRAGGCREECEEAERARRVRRLRPGRGLRPGIAGPGGVESPLRRAERCAGIAARSPRLRAARGALRGTRPAWRSTPDW